MYPFSFDEFLCAQGLNIQVEFKQNQANPDCPLLTAFYKQMIAQLRTFYLVGGMPEAVKVWTASSDFRKCATVHNDILDTYTDDFSKDKTRISPLILSSTLKSVALLTGNKFVYFEVGSKGNALQIKESLDLLTLAGLIIPVTHTAANVIPLGAEINPKYRKLLFLDIGLMQTLLGLQASDILLTSDIEFVNKGGLSELFAGLGLVKYGSYLKKPALYYWQRTERNAQAEVDYIISKNGEITPVEIKANKSGSMQSMYKLMETKASKMGYRVSLEPYGSYQKVRVVPLYALSNLIDKQ